MVGSGFLVIVIIALTVWAAVESFMADPDRVRGLPKTVWVIIVLLFLPFGAAAWFIFGRPRRSLTRTRANRATNWGTGAPSANRRSAPTAPDDDPEFLSRLREQMRNKPDDDQHS